MTHRHRQHADGTERIDEFDQFEEARTSADTTSGSVDLELLEQLAAQTGRSISDLRTTLAKPTAPIIGLSVKEYLASRDSPRTRSTYRCHLRRMVFGFGPVCDQLCAACMDPGQDFACRCGCVECRSSRITLPALGWVHASSDTLTGNLVADVAAVAKRHAIKKGIIDNRGRAARGKPAKRADGRNAEETAVASMRSFYGYMAKYCEPAVAQDVKKPRRNDREKRPLRPFELAELHMVTGNGGDDPELDLLLVDLAIATGVRASGAQGLVVKQLERHTQLINLKDKGGTTEPMPVSAELIDRLIAHAVSRGGEMCDPTSPKYVPDSPVFWKKVGGVYRPMTDRRFDNLSERWQRSLPWAMAEQLGYHHLRHTMGAILLPLFGSQVKKRYLRHADGNVSELYGRCTLEELARAMSTVLDFEHPLVHGIDEREKATRERLGLTQRGPITPSARW